MKELCLQGPGKNAIGVDLMDRLLSQLREASGAPVLLTGTPDVFSAGLNLKELAALPADGIEAFLRKFEALVETLYTYPGPTVACITGHAIAGGCVLALCCDHQVATSNPAARLGLNEVALGLQFPPLTLSVVRERIPRRHLNEVVLGGQLHDPSNALRLGLVGELASDPLAVGRQRLAALAAHPVAAYAATKAELRGPTVDDSVEEQRFREILPTWTSPELRRRIEARLQGK